MASRVAETLDRIGKGPYVNKIIRIGSPELNMDTVTYGDRTLDLIMPGDPVPLLQFQRIWNDKPIKDVYLYGMEYDTIDPRKIHMLYFKRNGTAERTNLEKTVNAILDNVD